MAYDRIFRPLPPFEQERLEFLAWLRDRGVLSDQEYIREWHAVFAPLREGEMVRAAEEWIRYDL